MIRTYCDFCGKEIKTPEDQVNIDFTAVGHDHKVVKRYHLHDECAVYADVSLLLTFADSAKEDDATLAQKGGATPAQEDDNALENESGNPLNHFQLEFKVDQFFYPWMIKRKANYPRIKL